MSGHRKIERILAVMGAAALVVMATDALTYAATGSSLILGKVNSSAATTTMQNTTTGGVPLKLTTKSAATPPLVVNGKGKVTNLYADRSANADKLGGKTLAQVKASVGRRPGRVLWVAPSGGDFTTLSAALASITDNSVTRPYLIQVAPGVYTETGSVSVKSYVTIEGSGENLTTIKCACVKASDVAGAAVIAMSGKVHTTLRNLTIKNSSTSGTFVSGVWIDTALPGEVALDHVTVTLSGNISTATGVRLLNASPVLEHMTVTVANAAGSVARGLYSEQNDLLDLDLPVIDSSRIVANGGGEGDGILASGTKLLVRNSQVTGSFLSVAVFGPGTASVMSSVLDGVPNGINLICSGSVSAATGVPLGANCLTV